MLTSVIAAAFVVAISALGCVDASAGTLSGKVVGVADGDTVTLLVDQETIHVRVAGIDAPERGQPFSQASKQGLSKCAFGQPVKVEWHKKDRYGRTVGKVMAGTVDCGLRQIEQGLAWHYKAYAKEQAANDRESYSYAEASAREARAGLWDAAAPVAPWEYRHQRRAPVEARDPGRLTGDFPGRPRKHCGRDRLRALPRIEVVLRAGDAGTTSEDGSRIVPTSAQG
jgi:endonuclease YncB( thermonuclease family)